MKLLVCDMAGTTVQDDGRVHRCFRQALQEFGDDASDSLIQTHMGRGKLDTLKAIIGVDKADQAYARFREILEQDYRSTPAQPLPGIEDVFRWAQSQGMKVSLNTGFYREVMDLILTQLGWLTEGLIDSAICDDDVVQGRPAPYMIYESMVFHNVHDVRDVVYAGDTISDMAAGKNARVKHNIGVLTGGETQDRLYKAGASAVFAYLTHYPTFLR